ncbi:lysis system i-spanin subunit Rz [Pseudomonas sp. D1HM]|uniref:lysis system i-spanin subunit Rz n=1 Tax=Pseudomonas sp. D1HM TaxID=1784816 RepID=UPI001C4EABA6|nr:lysis system i-spanin subunit Rz [Pseudomonas sp. D1HM]
MGMPTLMASNWPRRKSLTKPGLNISQCQLCASLVEQGKRLALEQWLAASDQSHYRALTDEETKQACQRDRLATADLRLSAQLDATAASGCDGMSATTSPGGVVHDAPRARLDPAHAQRIIGITGDGDQGLIALQACQAYVKEISALK